MLHNKSVMVDHRHCQLRLFGYGLHQDEVSNLKLLPPRHPRGALRFESCPQQPNPIHSTVHLLNLALPR